VNFVKRGDFLRFLKEYPEACLRVIVQLSEKYNAACHEMRSLLLAHSAEQKLARLLMEWSSKDGEWGKEEPHIKLAITQEEIAQMIGSSRETVTRAFADLRRRQIALVEDATLVIRNKSALKQIAGT
jgi:CRP/FNR family transcriptional regulator